MKALNFNIRLWLPQGWKSSGQTAALCAHGEVNLAPIDTSTELQSASISSDGVVATLPRSLPPGRPCSFKFPISCYRLVLLTEMKIWEFLVYFPDFSRRDSEANTQGNTIFKTASLFTSVLLLSCKFNKTRCKMDPSPDDDHDGNEYIENASLWKKALIEADAREQQQQHPCGRCDKVFRHRSICGTLMRDKRCGPVTRITPTRRHRLEQEPIPRNENQLRGIQLQEENPPVKPYTCDLLCAICYDQFFPASQVVDDNDASNTTRNLVDCIRSDLSYLRNSLKQHADLVVSRWKKKSKAKRLALLQELADLAPFRWASVHFMNMHNPRCDCRQGKIKVRSQKYDRLVGTYQDTWLTPYLDQDTLSEDPLRLLSLLHVRSAFQPEEWVMFDKWHVTLAEYHIVLIPEFNENCVVMEGPDYGKLVPWEEEKAHSWQIVGYCKARQILTAQKRIMHFLRKMMDALVGDQPFVDEPRVS